MSMDVHDSEWRCVCGSTMPDYQVFCGGCGQYRYYGEKAEIERSERTTGASERGSREGVICGTGATPLADPTEAENGQPRERLTVRQVTAASAGMSPAQVEDTTAHGV